MAVRHTGFVAEAAHSDGIASFVLREDAPLDWPVFLRTMETLIALRGPDLLRVKGLLNLAGTQGPGGVPGGAAPHPSAGRTGRLARRGPVQPRGLHHARRERAPGARPVRGVPALGYTGIPRHAREPAHRGLWGRAIRLRKSPAESPARAHDDRRGMVPPVSRLSITALHIVSFKEPASQLGPLCGR